MHQRSRSSLNPRPPEKDGGLTGRPSHPGLSEQAPATGGADPFPSQGRLHTQVEIRPDDLSGPAVRALLAEHLADMHRISPPESVHALDVAGLCSPDITFWAAWSGSELLGCGALKELDPSHGEVKSMRTTPAHRRKGVAQAMLRHIVDVAARRGYERLSLETGSLDEFESARRLYEGFGFSYCPPFGGYTEDPNSVFMTKDL